MNGSVLKCQRLPVNFVVHLLLEIIHCQIPPTCPPNYCVVSQSLHEHLAVCVDGGDWKVRLNVPPLILAPAKMPDMALDNNFVLLHVRSILNATGEPGENAVPVVVCDCVSC